VHAVLAPKDLARISYGALANTCANAITWANGVLAAICFGAAATSHNGIQLDTSPFRGCGCSALCSRIDLKLNVNRGKCVSVPGSDSAVDDATRGNRGRWKKWRRDSEGYSTVEAAQVSQPKGGLHQNKKSGNI